MFTLDQVRGFVAVADELHFGRAAARLQMTQPPLSRQIQKLERAVGVRLLERDNRSVELTAAGTAFLSEARRLLTLADGALDQARRIEAGSAGTVRIGFTATAAFGVLPQVLDRVAEAHPGVHLDLVELVSREQVGGLSTGEIDLGLARPPFDEVLFASRLLHTEELLVAVPAGHQLAARGTPVDPAELVSEKLIMYAPAEARYFHDLVLRLVPVADDRIVHSVSQVLTMLWLVAGRRGLAVVPASAARLGIAEVVLLPLLTADPRPVELHLLWERDNRNPALRAVLETLTAPL